MRLSFLLLVSLLLPRTIAQQYAGQIIPNSLPSVTGAELAFWNIKDSLGRNSTLINYMSLPTTTGRRQDTTKVQRVVINLPGNLRESWRYFSDVLSSLRRASQINPAVTEESVVIVALYFPNEQDSNFGYPLVNGNSTSSALVWRGNGWSSGDDNLYPTGNAVSSFDALDQILQYFDNRDRYPNLKQIVVSGHSRGGQMTNRYATVGKELFLRTPVVYWLANPSTLAWLDKNRPISTTSCPTYDNWMFGLSNYTNSYERTLVNNGRLDELVRDRYKSRDIAYARGLEDWGVGNTNPGQCAILAQGANRGERLFSFLKAFPPDAGDTVDYLPGIEHDVEGMITSEAGQYRLFLDNFDGQGSRHADFGPRQAEAGGVDNPHPKDT